MTVRRIDPATWARVCAFAALSLACEGYVSDGPLRSGDRTSDIDCRTPPASPAVLRRLTTEEFRNTVRDLLRVEADDLPLPADERVGAFLSNAGAPIGEQGVDTYARAAEVIAERAVRASSDLVCDADPACAERVIGELARRAFRREPTPDQLLALRAIHRTAREGGTDQDGIRAALEAILQSPYFLYHVVSGTPDERGHIALSGDDLAARLSYFLWRSMPDDALREAAARGELADPEGVRRHAERMLDDPRSAAAIRSFHLQWLGVDALPRQYKDPDVYPTYDAALGAAMQEETAAFADYVLRRGDRRLETLFTASYAFPRGSLWELYGLSPRDESATPVELPSQRAGLLTQPSFLTAHAHANQSAPIQRGVWILREILCQQLSPPPPDVVDAAPPPAPNETTRERFERHRSDPTCAGCHERIDGIGFALEHYDGIGRYRTEDGPHPIDASGWISRDSAGQFEGASGLASTLVARPELAECAVRQWFRFALGRREAREDQCTIEALRRSFDASGHDVRALILDVATSDAFRRVRID